MPQCASQTFNRLDSKAFLHTIQMNLDYRVHQLHFEENLIKIQLSWKLIVRKTLSKIY